MKVLPNTIQYDLMECIKNELQACANDGAMNFKNSLIEDVETVTVDGQHSMMITLTLFINIT